MITLMSFGYKFGESKVQPPVRQVDCRGCKNPHYIASLRDKTGLDKEVQTWCFQDRMFQHVLRSIVDDLKDGTSMVAGCVGGKHRSVAFVEILAKRLVAKGFTVKVLHRELDVAKTLSP